MKLVFQKKIAMKRKIYLFALLGLFLAATACQDDEETMPVVKPAESGTFVDERDGTEYGWVRIGNREWMTSNIPVYRVAAKYRVSKATISKWKCLILGKDSKVPMRNTVIITTMQRP